MAHPYTSDMIEYKSNGITMDVVVPTITKLVNVAAVAKEGDRCWVIECGMWFTRRTIILTDASTAARWVPDDPRFGSNNMQPGAGGVPCGGVTAEGVWVVTTTTTLVEADFNQTYNVLELQFDTGGGSIVIDAPAFANHPNFFRIACAKLSKTADANNATVSLQGMGYPGGTGGIHGGAAPTAGVGPAAHGQFYLLARGGGGGSGGESGASPGIAGADSVHMLDDMLWTGSASTNALGAIPSGVNGGVPNALAPAYPVEVFRHGPDHLVGMNPAAGGGGGGGNGDIGGKGGAGGEGGGLVMIDAACVYVPQGTLFLYAIGANGVDGVAAAPASGGGGGAGGGGGGGGFLRLRYRRKDIAGTLTLGANYGNGGNGGAGDGAGKAGGNGGEGLDGFAEQVFV